MGTITTGDGTEIFYKDWGTGQPVVFSHGWPLTADVWDDQSFLVASNGFRAIAHDRRGGGRSGQPWAGNDLDAYADDLADLIETLDLHDMILVGHRDTVIQDRQGRDPEGLPRRPARPGPDHGLQGHLQHRSARLRQGVTHDTAGRHDRLRAMAAGDRSGIEKRGSRSRN